MDSLWRETVKLPRFEPLEGDFTTDVLVIGGGLAGLLCADQLTRAGVDCALVEAERLCGGATQNTTAKITVQHGLIYDKLIREFGADKARLYLEANQRALEEYRALCRTMDCDFEEKDAFVYSLGSREKLDRELNALERLGFGAEFQADIPLPFPTAGAVKFKDQAQFHPLKFISAIAGELLDVERTLIPAMKTAPGGDYAPWQERLEEVSRQFDGLAAVLRRFTSSTAPNGGAQAARARLQRAAAPVGTPYVRAAAETLEGLILRHYDALPVRAQARLEADYLPTLERALGELARAERDGYALAGGFLFLGIVLGVIFLMATVLIIYYKQVSEGYEDQGRFEIMRKVGLSQRQVKSSIRGQVLIVFFLPILVAAVHILFDFNLVARMLTMFGVRNVMTVVLCTGGTLAAFLAVYVLVYLLTARTYYKIVK